MGTMIWEVKRLCNAFYQQLSRFQNTVRIDGTPAPEQIDAAFDMLTQQYPELFWVNGYSGTRYSYGVEVRFKVLNNYNADTLRRMYDMLNQKVQQILATISRNSSDYDKVLQIHDYLIQHTCYDSPMGREGKSLCHTAYGCLVNGRAVCQGYSEAFQLLMKKLRIECGICRGTARGERHAWNYVKVNQEYYWMDVTWDDPRSQTDRKSADDWIHHEYVLINDEMLLRSRKFDKNQDFRPVCRSLQDNYYVRNQNYLTKYQFSDINAELKRHVRDGTVELMFSTKKDFQTAVKELFEKRKILEADIFRGKGGEISYQANDTMYTIRIRFS